MTKADKEGQRKAPILRFKGFTDDWEQRQLREISSSTIGGGTPKSSNKKFWNGNIPWIQSSDLVNGDIWNITIKKHITLDAVENSAAKIISANSIAVVTRVAVGKLVYMPLEYATSQDFISFQNLSGDHSFFMYLVSKVMHKVKGSLQGTSIKGISKGELLKKKVIYTLNIKEQKKIGTLLKSLDTILTLYERKYQLYLLQFQKLQRVIFDNSDDFISLSSLIEIKTGNRNSQDNVKNGKYVFFDRSTEIKKLNEFDFDEEAIIIPGEGTKFAPKYVNGKYALHQRSYSLYNFSQEIDSKYLYYFLMTQSNTLLRYSVGTTVPSLRVSTFDHIKVPMYSKELQMKYASTFDSLEKLLSQIKEKTNILRSLKQFLLQVLFL